MAFDAANTYASVNDLKLRVSRNGYVWAADVDTVADLDASTVVDSAEDDYPEEALEYANTLVDEALTPHVDTTPRPQNAWCKDRVVDIAAARLFSLGGRKIPPPLQQAADEAADKLVQVREGIIRVPGLDYTRTLSNGRRALPVRAVNMRPYR